MGTHKQEDALVETRIQQIVDVAFDHVGEASRQELTSAFREFQGIDSDFVEVAHRMLHTGTPTGKLMAKHSIAFLYGYARDASWRGSGRDRYAASTCVQAKTAIVRSWAIGNVAHELDNSVAGSFSLSVLSANDHMELYSHDEDRLEQDEHYWRGLAALVYTVTSEDGEEEWAVIEHGGKFVRWIAHHPDLAAAVKMARSRQTINTGHLEHLLSQHETTTPSLRGGVL